MPLSREGDVQGDVEGRAQTNVTFHACWDREPRVTSGVTSIRRMGRDRGTRPGVESKEIQCPVEIQTTQVNSSQSPEWQGPTRPPRRRLAQRTQSFDCSNHPRIVSGASQGSLSHGLGW